MSRGRSQPRTAILKTNTWNQTSSNRTAILKTNIKFANRKFSTTKMDIIDRIVDLPPEIALPILRDSNIPIQQLLRIVPDQGEQKRSSFWQRVFVRAFGSQIYDWMRKKLPNLSDRKIIDRVDRILLLLDWVISPKDSKEVYAAVLQQLVSNPDLSLLTELSITPILWILVI